MQLNQPRGPPGQEDAPRATPPVSSSGKVTGLPLEALAERTDFAPPPSPVASSGCLGFGKGFVDFLPSAHCTWPEPGIGITSGPEHTLASRRNASGGGRGDTWEPSRCEQNRPRRESGAVLLRGPMRGHPPRILRRREVGFDPGREVDVGVDLNGRARCQPRCSVCVDDLAATRFSHTRPRPPECHGGDLHLASAADSPSRSPPRPFLGGEGNNGRGGAGGPSAGPLPG